MGGQRKAWKRGTKQAPDPKRGAKSRKVKSLERVGWGQKKESVEGGDG